MRTNIDPLTLENLAQNLAATLTPDAHLAVANGWTTVRPIPRTVGGVAEFFSPPYAAKAFRLELGFRDGTRLLPDDGNTGKGDCGILYAGGTWQPDHISRKGTYHQYRNGALISYGVCSELFPLYGQAGFVLRIEVENRGRVTRTLTLEPRIEPGRPAFCDLDDWGYAIPADGTDCRPRADGIWTNGTVELRLHAEDLTLVIPPGEKRTARLACTLVKPGEMPLPGNLADWIEATRQRWRRVLDAAAENLPRIASGVPGLEAYYRRSLLSGLLCLWDKPAFACQPFLSVCSLDGGGFCGYPWDSGGYAPNVNTMLLGERMADFARVMSRSGLDQHMRFSLTGKGRDVYYAYNTFSFFSLLRSLQCFGYLKDPALIQTGCDLLAAEERNAGSEGVLLDYGQQCNLLEMRGAGWEHFTVSPNAERAWCLEVAAALCERHGLAAPVGKWRAQAVEIRKQIQQRLWDPRRQWFRCLYPDGHAELVYSVQVFDALRAGCCTEAMQAALCAQVREGAFLGTYGVSSVSAEDRRHYEQNDPDWSGGGSYTGDGPILALTLWEQGRPALAWDVLQRHFWMGRHLLYYPQEHYCDRPAVAAHKRANICSGTVGGEAILFGLCGLRPHLSGALNILPGHLPAAEVHLENFRFRGRTVDLRLAPRRSEFRVDGKTVHAGPPAAEPVGLV
ncbi:MAG: hypothetical protein K9N49_00485 [Candidatus Marinimicrobia bacterium]|nr:hypothetical protein [Candidatus Neomarinimicrobiota bacterium]